jgi:hypothetical protein
MIPSSSTNAMKLVHVRTMSGFALLSCMVLSLTPAAAQTVVVPVAGVTPTLTSVAIDIGPNDKTDPHVSSDWAAYSSFASIRYYQFSTGVDSQIPMGASVNDLLSDISGSKIVFSRATPPTLAVMVFDAATGLAPIEIDPLGQQPAWFGNRRQHGGLYRPWTPGKWGTGRSRSGGWDLCAAHQ